MKLPFRSSRGFTLVELLIVITIIAILALGALAAINPIEQMNKAKDSATRSAAADLLSAIDRYYTANNKFPWNDIAFTGDAGYNADAYASTFKFRASAFGAGVCETAAGTLGGDGRTTTGCTATTQQGKLITTDELKPAYANKNAFKPLTSGASKEDYLYVVKEPNTTQFHVCFIPASKAARDNRAALFGYDITIASGAVDSTTSPTCPAIGAAGEPTWADEATSCVSCLPQ